LLEKVFVFFRSGTMSGDAQKHFQSLSFAKSLGHVFEAWGTPQGF
jgi:hypothetical protein